MARHLDIHNYALKSRQAEAQVRRSAISEHNKELIFRYRDVCLRNNLCGTVRLIRVMGVLTLFGRHLNKPFDAVTREDLEQLLSTLVQRQPAYTPETLGTYKAILKRFMTWIAQPHDFPTKHPPP